MSRAPVVLLLLASCATVSPERGHDRVAALVEERGGGATGWEQGPPGDDVIAERVAALLKQGLTRERAVAIALVNNPALLARYEDLGIAQAELVDAGLLSNPTLDGSVGFPLRGELLEFEGALLTNLLELLLLPSRKRIAAAQFDAATLQVAHDALQLVADVRKAFVSVQAAERTVELQQAAVAAAAAAAELTARQREAGNVSELQLVTERAAYERRRLELARDQLELLERREELNRLLGLWGGATGWALAEPLPELPKDEPPLERLESTALRRRLDVAAARKRAAVQEQALALARTTRYFGRVEIGAHTHRDPDGPLL
ncbi:MAG: TolC family protein, partial [Myxococcales bacterium]